MQNLIYYIATTLDGYIADSDGGFNVFEMTGPHIPDHDKFVSGCSTVLMGRATYDVAFKHGVSNPYPNLDTHVFSTSIDVSPHENVTIHSTVSRKRIQSIKSKAEGTVWLCGGGKLASQLIREGVVDGLILKVNPVVIGQGLRLFDTLDTPVKPCLTQHRTYSNGVIRLDYSLQSGGTL